MSDELAREINARLRRIESALKLDSAKAAKTQWVTPKEITQRTEWNNSGKLRTARESHLVIYEKTGDAQNGNSIYRYDISSVAPRYFINQQN